MIDRYLQFDNIDMQGPEVVSHCSKCRREFTAALRQGDRVEDVVRKIRVEYDQHECVSQ